MQFSTATQLCSPTLFISGGAIVGASVCCSSLHWTTVGLRYGDTAFLTDSLFFRSSIIHAVLLSNPLLEVDIVVLMCSPAPYFAMFSLVLY
jgi:hypothetical protein